jgi:hypothetical protein
LTMARLAARSRLRSSTACGAKMIVKGILARV